MTMADKVCADTKLFANVDDMKRFASKITLIPLLQNQTP